MAGRFIRQMPYPCLKGDYGVYRPYLQSDFQHCCVHCYMHEDWNGGHHHFEIDHFRPKGKFKELRKVYDNLYWSCHRCNKLKGERWPSEDKLRNGICFVDLCRDRFEDHYEILEDGTVKGKTESANYTIDMLRLNDTERVRVRLFIISHNYKLDTRP
jgi:hypothetical protein